MSTTDDNEIWRTFRTAGRAEGSPAPCGTPWAFTIHDLMSAWNVRATWISPELVEQSLAYPKARVIVCPYPVDTSSGTAAMEEVFHVARHDDLMELSEQWMREAFVKCKVREVMAARPELADQVEAAEGILSRRFVYSHQPGVLGYFEHALRTDSIGIEEARKLLPEWLLGAYGTRASNGHVEAGEVDDDELRAWLRGPR